jgi:hypothetical protein
MGQTELKKCLLGAIFIFCFSFCLLAEPYSNPAIERDLAGFFGLKQGQKVDVELAQSYGSVREKLPPLPEYVAGVAFPERGEIFIFRSQLGSYPFGSLEQVYAHEISHIYLYRAAGYRMPRWFDEGVAMRVSGEWGGKDDFYLALALPRIAYREFDLVALENDFGGTEGASRSSYAVSRAFVRDIFRSQGEMRQFVVLLREKGSFNEAFTLYFKAPPEILFERWAKKLPWWGPMFSILASTSSIWYMVVFLFLLASLVTFRRRKAWRKKWEEEERGQTKEPTIQ